MFGLSGFEVPMFTVAHVRRQITGLWRDPNLLHLPFLCAEELVFSANSFEKAKNP